MRIHVTRFFSAFVGISLLLISPIVLYAQRTPMTALGIDVDFYTGPISRDVWLQLKAADHKFVIAQAWGGRSRNEYASSQLAGARTFGGMKTAAYVLLNYDNKVCRPSAAQPDPRCMCRCCFSECWKRSRRPLCYNEVGSTV